MVNTTRASMMAQIAELKFFGIITKEEECKFVDKINEWNNRCKRQKLVDEIVDEFI